MRRDIEYLIEALGYAAGILHKVSEYVAEEFEVPDMNAKVESGSIKVSKSDLVLGDSVTVSWKSCISEKAAKPISGVSANSSNFGRAHRYRHGDKREPKLFIGWRRLKRVQS